MVEVFLNGFIGFVKVGRFLLFWNGRSFGNLVYFLVVKGEEGLICIRSFRVRGG